LSEGEAEAIRPFELHVAQPVLDDLRERLRDTRWPDAPPSGGWADGTDLDELRELCEYWRDEFDWRAVETRLCETPQFTTTLDELSVHFLHARSPESDALPLLITHGWPGSVLEFEALIPLLTNPRAHGADPADAFHVVCPSIPGFGFSEKPRIPGTNPIRIAAMWAELMARLGYDRYGAQGGDFGSVLSTLVGANDPAHCVGVHLNMVLAGPPKDGSDPLDGLTEQEQQHLASTAANAKTETGYYAIQSTKPQTLGYALNDSPVALAAWIVEKFRAWSDCDGVLESRFTKDQLLANITLYWVTGTITSSCRLYWEQERMGRVVPGDLPTGAAIFPGELIKAPRKWAEARYPGLVHWTEMPRGGHFAALEEPELLAEDVRAFFRGLREVSDPG
jgi:pimeloyl-ACP methyl ester carboxylesterase